MARIEFDGVGKRLEDGLRAEIASLQTRLDVTTPYIKHDHRPGFQTDRGHFFDI
jgi:hypothetical protein